jgi:hypothetical protein
MHFGSLFEELRATDEVQKLELKERGESFLRHSRCGAARFFVEASWQVLCAVS